jgi:hypothetical protein
LGELIKTKIKNKPSTACIDHFCYFQSIASCYFYFHSELKLKEEIILASDQYIFLSFYCIASIQKECQSFISGIYPG